MVEKLVNRNISSKMLQVLTISEWLIHTSTWCKFSSLKLASSFFIQHLDIPHSTNGSTFENHFFSCCFFAGTEFWPVQLILLSTTSGSHLTTPTGNCLLLRVLAHRKYRRPPPPPPPPRSRPHLIDHIFEARITLILLFASLFY